MAKILAGIVVFNSNFSRLLDCLAGLEKQVDSIIVWDNSPEKYTEEEIEKISAFTNCEYIYSNKNLGMPEGMNRIIRIAKQKNFDWVLTMNADSIVPDNLVEKYSEFFGNNNIGMICPQIIDKRRKYMIFSLGLFIASYIFFPSFLFYYICYSITIYNFICNIICVFFFFLFFY